MSAGGAFGAGARRALACLLVLAPAACRAQPAPDPADFYRVEVAAVAPGSVVDFAALNAPLAPADRLRACGGALCAQGSATPVRLFGVNLGFEAALPDAPQAERLVADLRGLGVNFLRLHALDAVSVPDDAAATGLLSAGPFPRLNPVAVARLRGLLQRCAENGIYVDLNLHVGYAFRPAIDGTLALDGAAAWPDQSKPFLRIDPAALRLQARYAQMLLTALRGAGTPALAMVEIDNESSLVYAWMDGSLARLAQSPVREALLQDWRAWRQAHAPALAVDADAVPALDAAPALAAAFLDFLVERDRRYVDTVRAAIAQAAPEVLVLGTQMNFGGLANVRALAGMDLFDGHFYVDHYRFPQAPWQWDAWRISDSSNLRDGVEPLLGMAFYRSFDKPFLVTEFNQPWPNRQAAEILPETALLASLQDWSGVAYYDYAHRRGAQTPSVPYEFSLAGDAAKRAQFGQLAWLFRSGAIAALPEASGYTPDRALQLRAVQARVTTRLAAFLQAQGVLERSSALTRRVGIGAPVAARAATAPAQVRFDLDAGQLRVAAPTVNGIVGHLLPGRRYVSGALAVRVDAANGMTALLLSSRDGRAIAQSTRLLLTLPGETLGSVPDAPTPAPLDLVDVAEPALQRVDGALRAVPAYTLRDPASGAGLSLREVQAPLWMRRRPCTVDVRSDARRLSVYPLDAAGRRGAPLDAADVRKTANGFQLQLQARGHAAAPWYELVAEQ
ncbi:hypothetical protein NRY95_20450 [Xanthomonas campestris pv. phormiicola]|nr:hypothetical protein [Xanthomonas campestris pv. phormiicola]UYC16025.1 hypothetical protein NRY95_20450 [Xanthomonas campestris pv. phormiicola]